jgi:histidyl-tRNA synthetase
MKLSVHGPLFRYERPQKGRYRQFHQIDAEIIGAGEPAADVELLVMADQLLKELGIHDGVTLQLNTLGDTPSRDAWRAALVGYFNDHKDALSEDSLARLEKNPLRILDSKDPKDRPIADAAPVIDDYLSGEAQDFFGTVTAGLDAAGVAWTRNAALVRGLDYYNRTVFEWVTTKLGAQGTIAGGGRYDSLVERLGGDATPACGFGIGLERVFLLMQEYGVGANDAPDVYLVNVGELAEQGAFAMAERLRQAGLQVVLHAGGGSFKSQMKKADRSQARYAIILGDDEVNTQQVGLKPMRANALDQQQQLSLDAAIAYLQLKP